jgi:para-aminobenzoate synthetase component 1
VASGITVIDLPSDLSVADAVNAFSGETVHLLMHSSGRVRERDSRYSFLTADPVEILKLDHVVNGSDPFRRLREWQQCLPECEPSLFPPFCGGIAGLMSYEFGEAFEHLPGTISDRFRTPSLFAGLFDWSIVWDHIASTVRLFILDLTAVSSGMTRSFGNHGGSPTGRRSDWVLQKIQSASELRSDSSSDPQKESKSQDAERFIRTLTPLPVDGHVPVWSNFSRDGYLAAVQRVLEYIRAGDIFQANLSQQLTAFWSGTAEELFRRISAGNPAPFSAMLKTPEFALVSASPERFIKVQSGRFVETRPIKGTRRRQRSPIADLYTTAELTHSEKDRAENVMIVDLLRNDLSRSCRSGTVRVIGLCEVELFETVQHLVSTVTGELRADKDVWDLIAGCFPGGSVTGAPKIRAMEIIAELERVNRGAYCGSVFCYGPGHDFDSSILIRTFTLKDGLIRFPVGGGIVADSSAEEEFRETLHKASGMLRVLQSGIR